MLFIRHNFLSSFPNIHMENSIHKGSELNNVKETWDQNEKNKENENPGKSEAENTTAAPAESEIDKIIKQEATEYDEVNKESQLLTGERATINSEPRTDTSNK
jgi:hypothetical protein